eukprot:TRINITY_DN9679_c0_g1_i2.p1 TRINITY_DN9679_c0_g1~~TRINITY_DN9679_c0_g1_i2.p1  ORF type:complete len:226 (+),score=48.25 TRINITY_DN9679_c0_g1_i2:71-748(+)
MASSSMGGDSRTPGMVECQIVSASGERITLQARRSSKVWELRDKIRSAMQIPSFEQHLFMGNVKMRSEEALSVLSSAAHDVPLTFTLVRSRVPDGISHDLASLLWRGFVALGKDCGDTLDGARTGSLLRFASLFNCADLLPGRSDIPMSWTFPQCLAYVAKLKQELAALSNGNVDSDESSDEESDAESDKAAPRDKGESRFQDLDLKCDARLMFKSRQTAHDDTP